MDGNAQKVAVLWLNSEDKRVKIISEMPIWMKPIQEQQKKQYLQLRKKFGLFKEERVYLRRVSSVSSKNSEASVFSNSEQMNDIDNLMSTPINSESEKEETVKITSEMPIWIKPIQEQQKKQYLQLRKKFGLFKEERVYLRRVSSVPSKNSEASVFSNSVQMNDIDNLMSTPINSESEKEEMIIGEEGGKLNIKRKTKATPVLENPKKRKNDVTTMQNSDFECNSSYSVMENLNNSCTQNLSEQEHSSFLQCPHNISNPWVCNNSEEDRVLKSTLNCHENETALGESSFKKDIFPFSHADLEETIKDKKITRLKLLLREREAALEALRKKLHLY